MGNWTREQIIRAILSRESAGLPLALGRKGANQALYQAGSRIFGSWPNALMAAGIPPERARSKGRWPPGKILAAIHSLSRRRHPLRPGELRERHGQLIHAARRCFGSWSKALIAAGVDPLKLRRVPPWTKERVIEAILTRALNNEPLGSRTVRPRSLADAGGKLFGTWASALAAAGIDSQRYGAHECRPTDEATPANCEDVPDHLIGVVPEGAVEIGSIGTADDIKATAGRKALHCWSRSGVLQAIMARLHERRVMNAKAVYRDDRPLYRAATRRFGNWSNALRAAGLNPDEHRKYPKRRSPSSHDAGGVSRPGLTQPRA
jgi:hypothetical protein